MVAIRSLKRFATDWYFENIGIAKERFPVLHDEKVAVAGAGPAGLTCAYFLAEMGYRVAIFEAGALGGGMLGMTVPDFRLPRQIIDMEIAHIESRGVEIHYNSPIDARHNINNLMDEGYKAVFIAAGAQASKHMGIPGESEDLENLYYGLNYLNMVKKGGDFVMQGFVIVIGGGNVAIDVARTAIRSGASEVQLFCLEPRDEMPAWEKEVKEAIDEGIIINSSWSPAEITHSNNRAAGIKFIRCVSVFDDDGSFNPVCDETETQFVEAGNIIISIGQAQDMSFLSEDGQLERALWGALSVDENRLSTNVPGVFAGGDFTAGPTFVINAIASGRRAALAIDKYLRGDKTRVEIPDEKTAMSIETGLALDNDNETKEDQPRIEVSLETPDDRIKDFREVEKGFASEKEVFREAGRCLRCDLENERR